MPQFDLLSADVENTETLNLDFYTKGLELYLPPVNYLLKRKGSMCRRSKKMRSQIVRCYAEQLIDLNEYLASFLGDTLADKIGVTKLNEIIFNSMPIRRSKQALVKGFDCEYKYTFKRLLTCLSIWTS